LVGWLLGWLVGWLVGWSIRYDDTFDIGQPLPMGVVVSGQGGTPGEGRVYFRGVALRHTAPSPPNVLFISKPYPFCASSVFLNFQ